MNTVLHEQLPQTPAGRSPVEEDAPVVDDLGEVGSAIFVASQIAARGPRQLDPQLVEPDALELVLSLFYSFLLVGEYRCAELPH